MHEVGATITRLKGRWMTGGAGTESIPGEWQALAAGDALHELTLLALAGQATRIAFRPAPGAPLAKARPLPQLRPPSLPEALRSQFRSLVATAKPDARQMALILTLMARRGHAAHPADWMPGAGDEGLAGIYAPWLDWRDAEDGRAEKDEQSAKGLAPIVLGAIVKDPVQDKAVLEEYLETVLKKRRDYADYYAAMTDLV
jgi:hypothetical protein